MGDVYVTAITEISSPFPLHPEWGFRDEGTTLRSAHRTQSGHRYAYLWGEFFRYRVPLRFVNSATQAALNGWWRDQAPVAFTLDSSVAVSTVLCQVVNRTVPIHGFTRPYADLFEGMVELESVDTTGKTRRPFILDDDVFGLLDQDYNCLVG